jgi:phosphatidylglycerophosphate synthase
MWLAHALTLSRLPIAVAFWWAYGSAWAVVLIALAALSDTLDGNVARYMKRRGVRGPDIGGWLDPIVDKLFVVIAGAAIWHYSGDLLVIVLVCTRELLLAPLVVVYFARGGSTGDLHADVFGKLATIAQFVALAVVLAWPTHALIAASIAALLGALAVVHYAITGARRAAL